jgi:hypothetical protein
LEISQFVEKLQIALELARQETWDHPVPRDTLRLGILLRMLDCRAPDYWNMEANKLATDLLHNSLNLAQKLNEFDALALGFGMRTQRFFKTSG